MNFLLTLHTWLFLFQYHMFNNKSTRTFHEYNHFPKSFPSYHNHFNTALTTISSYSNVHFNKLSYLPQRINILPFHPLVLHQQHENTSISEVSFCVHYILATAPIILTSTSLIAPLKIYLKSSPLSYTKPVINTY